MLIFPLRTLQSQNHRTYLHGHARTSLSPSSPSCMAILLLCSSQLRSDATVLLLIRINNTVRIPPHPLTFTLRRLTHCAIYRTPRSSSRLWPLLLNRTTSIALPLSHRMKPTNRRALDGLSSSPTRSTRLMYVYCLFSLCCRFLLPSVVSDLSLSLSFYAVKHQISHNSLVIRSSSRFRTHVIIRIHLAGRLLISPIILLFLLLLHSS